MSIEKLKNTMLDIYDKISKNKVVADVVLVGATKTRSIEIVENAVRAGLTVAGENRVQELLSKYKVIEGLSWHFIGALQTNKVKYIVDKVDMIHSLDRIELATEINKRCKKIGKIMPVLVEVNIGGELSKTGVKPEDLFEFVEQIKSFPNIRIEGLMSVLPKFADDGLYSRMAVLFDELKQKFPELPIRWLSMGMSNDFEKALNHGANMIRLGSMLFGERCYAQSIEV